MIIEQKDVEILSMLVDKSKYSDGFLDALLCKTDIFHYLIAAKIIDNNIQIPDLQEIYNYIDKSKLILKNNDQNS